MPELAASNVRQLANQGKASGARHVLFVIDQLETLQGGAEQALLKMTSLLDPERYSPTVAVLNKPKEDLALRRFVCPVEVLDVPRTYGWSAIRAARRLRSIIRERNISIVQTHFESSDLWAGPIAKVSGTPILISSRRDLGFRRRPLHRLAYRLARRLYDRVHAVSDPVREYTIRQDCVDPAKIITISNGVHIDELPRGRETAEFRQRYGLQNASHLILDLTTIRRVKGVDLLMRTASRVRVRFPRAVFVVAGGVLEQACFEELQQLSAVLGLGPNFRLLGGVDDVKPLLAACDVFCHLSRNDGMSNAVLEAMGSGVPCVVSRCGGNPAVLGDGGFVVDVGDAQAAADRVEYLLCNADEARRLGARGRQIVRERYSAQAMVRDFMALYDEALSEKSRRSGT